MQIAKSFIIESILVESYSASNSNRPATLVETMRTFVGEKGLVHQAHSITRLPLIPSERPRSPTPQIVTTKYLKYIGWCFYSGFAATTMTSNYWKLHIGYLHKTFLISAYYLSNAEANHFDIVFISAKPNRPYFSSICIYLQVVYKIILSPN